MTQRITYDRQYLEQLADDYLDALLAREPARLPLHEAVRFTENGVDLKPGDGLWGTITKTGNYRHYVSDTTTGQVGLVTTTVESSIGAIHIARLAVVDGRITELETMVIRSERCSDAYERRGAPRDIWFRPVPPDDTSTRDDMIAAANAYFNGLQRNDGRTIPPFSDDCDRTEGGIMTTNVPTEGQYGHWLINDFVTRDAKSQFGLGLMQFVTEIRDRRFPLVDEERGVVFAYSVFDHDGTVNPVRLSDGRVLDAPPFFLTPRSLPVVEIFKVEKGLLHQVDGNLTEAPYGSRHGWEA